MKNGYSALLPDPIAIVDVPKKTYTPQGCLVALHVFPAKPLASGLVLPEKVGPTTGNWEVARGIVIAAGPECKHYKEGDEVICFNPATLVIHQGQRTCLIREDHLAGIVEESCREYTREGLPV